VQQPVGLRRAGDVMRCSAAALAPQRDVGVLRGRYLSRVALNGSRAGRTTQRRTATVVADEEKGLSGIVRVRTWLAHELSSCNEHGAARFASRRVTLLTAIP
jgi:hypothetical protein